MSGMGNTAEADTLKLLFQNIDWNNLGDAGGLRGSVSAGSFYIGLATAALSGTSTQASNEAAYPGYGRVAVVRSAVGWTVTGAAPTTAENAAATTFGTCTSGTETETDAQIGRDAAGAGETITWGPLTLPLTVSAGITPTFAVNAYQATLF